MQKGLFIVLEGGEGSTKTTQSRMLAYWFEERGIPHLLTREPDGQIRQMLLDTKNQNSFHAYTEVLLFAASRINKFKMEIEPALQDGRIVICDRYVESSMAYQGYAGDVGMEKIHDIHNMFISDERITILLKIPQDVSMERMHKRSQQIDRMEQKGAIYHGKVLEGYDLLASKYPHIKTVDATRSAEDIHQDILNILVPILEERGTLCQKS